MRDELIGYLCNAIEPDQRAQLERQLAVDTFLQRDLATMRRALAPLESAVDLEPPPELARRACEFVWNHDRISVAPTSHPFHDKPAPARRWSLADMLVMVGVGIAACAILLPAINQSRTMARLTACGDNLRELGLDLTQYSSLHHDTFPEVPTAGNEAVAGVYAPKLRDAGLLDDPRRLICPASALAESGAGTIDIPSLAKLNAARGQALADMQRRMGGSYGYSLGHVSPDGSKPTRNMQRSNFAIMADKPLARPARHASLNHGAPGQNVLFEDGHVQHLITSKSGGRDDIFVNDKGQVSLGLHRGDAVIAPSDAKPIPVR